MRVAREWRSAKMTSQKIYIYSEYIISDVVQIMCKYELPFQ